MHTNRESEAHKHEGDLIHIVSQGARPAKAEFLLQERAKGVGDAVDEGVDEDVAAREAGFGQVGDDDAADGVSVYEAGVEDEGDEVVVEDFGLEVEVGGDEDPGGGEGEEAEEGDAGTLATGAAGFHHVEGAGIYISILQGERKKG